MNPNDWIYHLSLRSALREGGFRYHGAPDGDRPEPARRPRLARAAAAGLALLAPALLLASALMGG